MINDSELDIEIVKCQAKVKKLYELYMDNISLATIDFNANTLIIIAKELEGLRYLIANNSSKNCCLWRKAVSGNFMF